MVIVSAAVGACRGIVAQDQSFAGKEFVSRLFLWSTVRRCHGQS